MNRRFFKKITLILCALLMAMQFHARAQSTDNHFIYIQAKDKQPFYVILNSKVYSSSTIGYLIIPKLKNGNYALKVGFPKQSADESVFKCVVNDADVGYSLQKNDNGNLGLLDLQTQSFITAANSPDNNSSAPVTAAANTVADAAPATSSAFGDMLSSVANDSTLKQQPKPVVTEPKAVMQQQNIASANIVTDNNPVQSDSFGSNPQADAKAVIAAGGQKNLKPAGISNDADQTYGVIKSSENTTAAGQQMTFVLFNSRSTDTVQIVIPQAAAPNNNESPAPDHTSKPDAANQYGDRSLALFKNSDGDTVFADDNGAGNVAKSSSGSRKNKKVHTLDNGAPANTDAANNVNNPFYSGTSVNNSSDNSRDNANLGAGEVQQAAPPCDNPLSDKDLQKTQKKMIGKGNDDDMLSVADKAIKGKCVTTQQIKQLGSLFLSDAGRFAIYQDAYPYVSDKDNYASLQNQLLDTYFKKRFLDMLKNQ